MWHSGRWDKRTKDRFPAIAVLVISRNEQEKIKGMFFLKTAREDDDYDKFFNNDNTPTEKLKSSPNN